MISIDNQQVDRSDAVIPKVTAIIPCYNREMFIRETLESVLGQSYENMEIIAVDDGSTDHTREILEEYRDRIKIMEHKGRENKGQSAAINLALHASQSDYVAILDSDDLWLPTKIEKQVDFLERDPSTGLVYANGLVIDENGRKLWKIYPEGYKELNKPGEVLVNCYFLLPNNALLRRSVFEKAGDFDETLRSAQDHDMAIRVAEITCLGYLDEILFKYRKHSDSQSYRFARRRWGNGFIIYEKARKRYRYTWNVRRRRLAVLNFRMGQCLLEESAFLRAIPHFLKAGLLDPRRAIRLIVGRESAGGLH